MKKGYWVVRASINNLNEYSKYIDIATAVIKKYDGIPIDRHNQDFVEIINQATNGRGVDHILDPISGENLKRSLKVLAMGGKVYSYGMSAAAPSSKRSLIKAYFAWRKTPKLDPLKMMSRNQGIFGVHMGTWDETLNFHQIHFYCKFLQKALKYSLGKILLF